VVSIFQGEVRNESFRGGRSSTQLKSTDVSNPGGEKFVRGYESENPKLRTTKNEAPTSVMYSIPAHKKTNYIRNDN